MTSEAAHKPVHKHVRKQRFSKTLWSMGKVVAFLAGIAFVIGYFSGVRTSTILLALALASAGFLLPLRCGWHERTKRAIRAKWREKRKWGFHSRDRDVPWVAHIEGPLILREDCAKGKRFYSEWLIIHDGLIIVNPGYSSIDKLTGEITYDHSARRAYAWDGCTPKLSWFWLALLGTPDWWQRKVAIVTVSQLGVVRQEHVFWPMTHYASVVHDALYQYLRYIPIPPDEVDRLFLRMLKDCGMWPGVASFYYFMVKHFGGQDIKRDGQIELPPPRVSSVLLEGGLLKPDCRNN